MRGRAWIVLGGLVCLVAVLVVLRGQPGGADSPDHRSDSDAANGASALRLYAEALGHPTGTVEGDFVLPTNPGILIVLTPTSGFSASQAGLVNTWVTSGGILVYADEVSEPQLDSQFGLHRGPTRAARTRSGAPGSNAPAPILAGVTSLAGGVAADQLLPSPGQVVLLRNRDSEATAVRTAIGQGQVIALTDPLILCNGYLGQADNGRFAADLIALAPPGSRILFDEFHHGAVAASSPATAWMTTPWGAALLWAVVVLFAGAALRGRAFGPVLTLRSARDRSSAEYAAAVGRLLHRSGARAVTLDTLLRASRRAIAERAGLGSGVPAPNFQEAIGRRAPAASRELAQIEDDLGAATQNEAAVLATARRLHELAYPVASTVSRKESG